MSERASILAPFRHETFRTLWLATLISNLGGLVQAVGAGWMMTTLTTSHNMVALVQASNTLPIMVFSIAAGEWDEAKTAAWLRERLADPTDE